MVCRLSKIDYSKQNLLSVTCNFQGKEDHVDDDDDNDGS